MNQKIAASNGRSITHPENSQELILTQHKQESRVDSRLFAQRVRIKHKNLYALIQNHKAELRELGTLPFQTETCAHTTGATTLKYVLLNEHQFDYLCRIVRGRDAAGMKRLKLEVTKAFAHRRAAEPIRREYLPCYHGSRDGLKALGAKQHHYINLARAETHAVRYVGEHSGIVVYPATERFSLALNVEELMLKDYTHDALYQKALMLYPSMLEPSADGGMTLSAWGRDSMAMLHDGFIELLNTEGIPAVPTAH